jgi:hypothetical protein
VYLDHEAVKLSFVAPDTGRTEPIDLPEDVPQGWKRAQWLVTAHEVWLLGRTDVCSLLISFRLS